MAAVLDASTPAPVYANTAGVAAVVTASFTPPPGAVILVKIYAGVGNCLIGTPTATGITALQRVKTPTSSNTNQVSLGLYTGIATGSAMTVSTGTFTGSNQARGLVVEVWTGAQLAATPATGSTWRSTNPSAPSATVTTTGTGSIVSWSVGDLAGSTSNPTYRASATQTGYNGGGTGPGTFRTAYQTAATAGSQTYGLTAPTMNWYLVGIEIQAAASTTPVSMSLAVSWATRAAATATTAVTWATRAARTATTAVSWAVRNPVDTSTDVSWAVRITANAAVPAAWAVVGRAAATTPVTWQVRGRVAQAVASAWAVRNPTSTSVAVSWAVRASAGATTAVTWSSRALVARSSATGWAVRGTTARTAAVLWQVRSVVTATLAAAWSVRGRTTGSVSSSWNVAGRAVLTAAGTWSVRAAAAATWSETWQTRARVTALTGWTWAVQQNGVVAMSHPVSWQVRTSTAATVTSGWAVRSASSAVWPMSWQVRAVTTTTLASAWRVDAAGVVSAVTGTWQVRQRQTATYPSTWNVAVQIQAATGWTWNLAGAAAAAWPFAWQVRAAVTAAVAADWRVGEALTERPPTEFGEFSGLSFGFLGPRPTPPPAPEPPPPVHPPHPRRPARVLLDGPRRVSLRSDPYSRPAGVAVLASTPTIRLAPAPSMTPTAAVLRDDPGRGHPDRILLDDGATRDEGGDVPGTLLVEFTVRGRTVTGVDDDDNRTYGWADVLRQDALDFTSRAELSDSSGETRLTGRLLIANPDRVPIPESSVAVGPDGAVWRVQQVTDLPGQTLLALERIDG
jgi:hypothetical protein